ncbi:hypothetical protein G3I55_09860 [Streptomyces sp. SID6648]|nr:hypothetical protein [Streptomyces sp. SID6648]
MQTEQVLASPDGLPDALTASRPLAGTISRRNLNEPVKAGRVDRGNGLPSNSPADPLAPRRPERRRPGALHTEDDDAGSIARAWIKTYAKDAQGQVTADFEGEGSVRQEVVLHFAESRRTQEITFRIDNETWGAILDSSNPARESP